LILHPDSETHASARSKSKYGGLEPSQLRRLKDLERENGQLKKIVADQALDIQMLRDVNSKNW